MPIIPVLRKLKQEGRHKFKVMSQKRENETEQLMIIFLDHSITRIPLPQTLVSSPYSALCPLHRSPAGLSQFSPYYSRIRNTTHLVSQDKHIYKINILCPIQINFIYVFHINIHT